MKYDIFISYRREGGFDTAKHLSDLLSRDGYKVSFDIDTLRNGKFDTQLLSRIEKCKDFILIIDSNAFQRTFNPEFPPENDWLRMELAHALKHHKNIIPVFLSGVKGFPDNLPEDISPVARMNGPEYNKYYFNDFYNLLKKRFLKSWGRKKRILVYAVGIAAIFISSLIFAPEIYTDEEIFVDPLIPHTTSKEQFIEYANTTLSKVGSTDKTADWLKWQQEAEEEIAESQFHAALCCIAGYGRETDEKKAFKYFRKAAEQGYAEAKYGLSVCYDKAIGTSMDPDKAISHSHEAAQDNVKEAQSDYGIYCSAGNDMNECFKWLQKSALEGYVPAQYSLAWAYASNNNNLDMAMEWMNIAMDNGYVPAKLSMANICLWGYEQYRDIEKGIEILKELVDQDNTMAQYCLAKCLINSYGIEYDYNKAKELVEIAAEKNFAPALTELGILYCAGGNDTSQDTRKALEYFYRAADQGYAMAQFQIGQIYANGWGAVKRNIFKAYYWFNKANRQGINQQTISQSQAMQMQNQAKMR